ncbi:MAG: GntR family transcriptional regulator [Clostridiales bacterium]|jgi:GntR family transcriptional regulator|nr:GntR family transcriptional regulator [Clostridiales bacterium]
MLQLDYRDRRPLYEQIKEKMKELIINGILKQDERIPSVRELAQLLTINPNTIQKAYKDLEVEGFIYSIRGRGSFVAPLNDVINQTRLNELTKDLEKLIAEMMYVGLTKEQIISSVDRIYKERQDKMEDD